MNELVKASTRVVNLVYLFMLIWGINKSLSWIMTFA